MNNKHYYVGNLLFRAEHAMGKAFSKVLRPLRITPAQAGVLLHIDRFPEITMAKVADIASITPQTMQRIVMGLEHRKLVQRNKKEGDRKSFYLSLTPSGKDLLDKAEAILKDEQSIIKEEFSPQELDTLYSLLERFESAFSKTRKEGNSHET
jgi:DNA-binding MarR family transcriptional regulator